MSKILIGNTHYHIAKSAKRTYWFKLNTDAWIAVVAHPRTEKSDRTFSVARTQRQLQNRDGLIKYFKVWKFYPSARNISLQKAWDKVLAEVKKHEK